MQSISRKLKGMATERPEVIIDLKNGKFHYNSNIRQVSITAEDGSEATNYEYDTLEISGTPCYETLVNAMVRQLVSAEEEFALINKFNDYQLGLSTNESDREKYIEYRQKVLAIKAEAREVFA